MSSKTSAFGTAFKAARAEGKDVFEFNGKKYHTRQADEASDAWKDKMSGIRDSKQKADMAKVKKAAEGVAESNALSTQPKRSQGPSTRGGARRPTPKADSDLPKSNLTTSRWYTPARQRNEMAKGGKVRGSGCATRGKGRGKFI